MLIDFLFRFFVTFAGTAIGDAPAPAPAPTVQIEKIETERVAQVRLAEVLGTADGIHSVSSRGKQITFVITRGEEAFRVVADTRKGEVIALTVAPMSSRGQELGGGLSWLADGHDHDQRPSALHGDPRPRLGWQRRRRGPLGRRVEPGLSTSREKR
jgi:hypothetical protein